MSRYLGAVTAVTAVTDVAPAESGPPAPVTEAEASAALQGAGAASHQAGLPGLTGAA